MAALLSRSSLITSQYDVGCCIGAVATAIFGEALGRRKTIMIGAVFMLAGAGAQAGVSNVGGMIAARIVSVSATSLDGQCL
jgi:MFS family permease